MNLGVEADSKDWFCWLPRAIFLVLVIAPFLEVVFYNTFVLELGPKYWDLSIIPKIVAYGTITIIAWIFPISGGIVALVAIPLLFIITIINTFESGLSSFDWKFLYLEIILLLLGGILAVIWGIRRRRRQSAKK
jgi:hypothetical protein